MIKRRFQVRAPFRHGGVDVVLDIGIPALKQVFGRFFRLNHAAVVGEMGRPLEVAAFTDQEGNLVGDFLGSRAFTGTLVREPLEKDLTQFGVPFEDILENTEFSIDGIMRAAEERPEIEAFLELHIEQGHVLETEEKPIGIVDAIAGKNW